MSNYNHSSRSDSLNCVRSNVEPSLPLVTRTRPRSSTDRGSWGKTLTGQRKMSLELSNHYREETKSSRGRKMDKQCPRLSRTFRTGSETTMEVNLLNKCREKTERQSDLVKIMKCAEPFPGDDPLILEGIIMLEKFDKSLESIEQQSSQSWITLVDCKLKLQRLLLEKVKSIAEEDCITLIQDGRSYVRQIETIYTEDQYKLETACNIINLTEKDRKVALDDFMGTSKKRKDLPNETQKRFNSWVADLNNCHRLLNINYRVPKERLTVLMVEQTAIKLEKIKATILHWLSLTLTVNIKIMSIYWDHLPFETLNDIFVSCLTFNQLWPSQAIDPITILSETQAESASSRIAFLIQSEAKKITSAKRRVVNSQSKVNSGTIINNDIDVSSTRVKLIIGKEKKILKEIPTNSPSILSSRQNILPPISRAIGKSTIKDEIGSTSDYCTNSSTSNESANEKNYLNVSGETIDLPSYLSIVLSSSQRIVLKLSFILQTAFNGLSSNSFDSIPAIKSKASSNLQGKKLPNSPRATWSKVKSLSSSSDNGNNLVHDSRNCFDNLYWPVFWKNFTGQLIDNILFGSNNLLVGAASYPIFFTPKSFQLLIHNSIVNCLKENEFPLEAIKEIQKIATVLNYHLTDQTWFKIYLDIYQINSDRCNQVFGRSENTLYVPEAVELIKSLISIVHQETDYGAFQVYQICSIKQIDSLLRLMINHTNNVSNKKPVKDLIQFYKEVQTLEKSIRSLQLEEQSNCGSNEILGLLNSMMETLESKVIAGIQKLTLQTFAQRISQSKGNQNEPIIPYVKQLILEPNLELLTDCYRSQYISRLKSSMIGLFAKIIYQIVMNDGFNNKLKLNRNLRLIMRQEIIDFIHDYDGCFKSNHQQLSEIDDLRQLIDESTKSKDCSIFKRFNRIYPIPSNWNQSQAINSLNDLQRCGCFF